MAPLIYLSDLDDGEESGENESDLESVNGDDEMVHTYPLPRKREDDDGAVDETSRLRLAWKRAVVGVMY